MPRLISPYISSLTRYACACALVASVGYAPVSYADAQDAAFDKRNQPVVDKRGNCVRTKWDGDRDPCSVAEPEPAAPPPPPPPVAKAPSYTAQQIREFQNIYFDFNKDTLTAASQDKLNKLARVINLSREIKDVQIVGYADEIGNAAYNQKLSQRRANAVERYLDKRSNIDSSVAKIAGKGELNNASCDGMSRAAKIQCLKSDRRVEVKLIRTEMKLQNEVGSQPITRPLSNPITTPSRPAVPQGIPQPQAPAKPYYDRDSMPLPPPIRY